MRRAIMGWALWCSVAAALLMTSTASATFPGTNGKIAFYGGGNTDIYSVDPDGSNLTNLTNHPARDQGPAWSPDGSRIAFHSNRVHEFDDEIFVMNADGTGVTQLTFDDLAEDLEPTWSPDGTQIAWARDNQIWKMGADGSNPTQLTFPPVARGQPAWSSNPNYIAFVGYESALANVNIYRMASDGTAIQRLTATPEDDFGPDWSPDGALIAWSVARQIRVMNGLDGSNQHTVPNTGPQDRWVSWAPEGTGFAIQGQHAPAPGIFTVNELGNERTLVAEGGFLPAWQPLPPPPPPDPGYPRPKGATPVHVYLVPAYEPCSTPNREHGPPLAFGSCTPPAQSSQYLTVGTSDANAHPTRFIGSVKLRTVVGNPLTPADEADVALTADITDVLCAVDLPGTCTGALSDYTGELGGAFTARITDRAAGYSANQPGTLQDLVQFPFAIPCAATADPDAGGSCALATSFDALMPGVIREGKRTMWQIGQIEISDGGADGTASSDDNTLFARQGVFVP